MSLSSKRWQNFVIMIETLLVLFLRNLIVSLSMMIASGWIAIKTKTRPMLLIN